MSMRKRSCTLPIAFTFFTLAIFSNLLGQVPQRPGNVYGTVVSEDGKPVPQASVTVYMPATPAISRTTKSASNGTFNIGGLPAGSYIVCIQSNGLAGSHLDPCEWSNNPDTFTIAPGQSAFLRQALIKQASTLQIRINDPSQFLAPRSVHEEPPEVTMELLTPSGRKVHPVLSSTDRTGRTYELRVAFDTPLHLSVSGKHVALNDDRGAAVQAAGSLLSFQHTTADPNPKSFTFTVSSRSK